MKIKKIFFILISIIMMSCSSSDNDNNINLQTPTINIPQTEVFIQGGIVNPVNLENLANINGTRSGIVDRNYNKWPYVNIAEGWETARFSIRADGKIVDVSNQSSALYFGRSAGKMGRNRGAVYTMYNYGHYDDRGLDYYQKDKKTGNNIGLFRYVHDNKGIKTQLAIEDAPLVIDILADEKEDLEAAIIKEQNTNLGNKITTMITKNSSNKEKLYVVDSLMALGSDYLEKHVLWYVVKEVGMRNGWHVNGIISENEVEKPIVNPSKIENNVEIDIHQQKHNDWCEIKTSIHIREDIESIKINIPIREDNVLEQDDFDIRIYDCYYKEYIISHKITHDTNGITIEISNIPSSFIEELKNNFGDGLTIEIHSYCKREEEVWQDLKNSKVINTGKPCTLIGQITSVLKPEEKILIK